MSQLTRYCERKIITWIITTDTVAVHPDSRHISQVEGGYNTDHTWHGIEILHADGDGIWLYEVQLFCIQKCPNILQVSATVLASDYEDNSHHNVYHGWGGGENEGVTLILSIIWSNNWSSVGCEYYLSYPKTLSDICMTPFCSNFCSNALYNMHCCIYPLWGWSWCSCDLTKSHLSPADYNLWGAVTLTIAIYKLLLIACHFREIPSSYNGG